MVLDGVRSVPMKLEHYVPKATILGDKTASRDYTWVSGLLDFKERPDFLMQLLMAVDDNGWWIIHSEDMAASLNFFPKDKANMPKDIAIGFNDDGNRTLGFGVRQNLNRKDRSRYIELIEVANGGILSRETGYTDQIQKGLRERLDVALGKDFPFALETYKLLRKSYTKPNGSGHEKLYEKYKNSALKRFEKYVLI